MRVKVSNTVVAYLEGGDLWQSSDDLERHGYGEAGRSLILKIKAASGPIDLTTAEVEVLRDLADYMEMAARDDAGYEASARGELNAARALTRQIENGGWGVGGVKKRDNWTTRHGGSRGGVRGRG